MKTFLSLSLVVILMTGCKNQGEQSLADKDQPVTTRIAYAYGYENWENVNRLDFTFNVKVNDSLRSQRSWSWFPKENKIELTEKGETRTYTRDGDLAENEKDIDHKFINDTYWLLFPFQLIWSDYEFEHNRNAVTPISQETMEHLKIIYPSEGGYTPGDTYHLYFKDDHIIKEWIYESSSGRRSPSTWEDHKTFNGITIAQMHKSEDGSFQLFFTDIKVE
jgi:hypothetical protein